jgi:Ser/Thr protein kinase RdoA (MazF antagonist)
VSLPGAVLELLGRRRNQVEPLDSRGEPWLLQTEDWRAVLRRFPPRRYPPEANFAHVAWLHRFLDRLATTGFPAPRPLRALNDASMAVVDGAIWEVLSYVPGRALIWDPAVPVESAGALLARFRQASLAIPPRSAAWSAAARRLPPGFGEVDRRSLSPRSAGRWPRLCNPMRRARRLHGRQHAGRR